VTIVGMTSLFTLGRTNSQRSRILGLAGDTGCVLALLGLLAAGMGCNSDRARRGVDASAVDAGAVSDGAGSDGSVTTDAGCDGVVIFDTCRPFCDNYGGWVGAEGDCILWCTPYRCVDGLTGECTECTDRECGAEKTALFGMDSTVCPTECKQCAIADPPNACDNCAVQCDGYPECREALGRYQVCVAWSECDAPCGLNCD